MYQIYCDDIIIHDPRSDDLKVIKPVCELGLNKTGSLTFQISSKNPNYNTIQKLKSEISVYQDGEWLFSGRVLNDEIKFNKIKNIECEGEFAYFLDSIQRNAEYHVVDNVTKNKIQVLLEELVNIHNEQVEPKKQFVVGNVTLRDTSEQLYKFTSFQNTHQCLNDKLLKTFGGYLITRNENGVKYLDYLDNQNLNISSQIIRFGENIIDMTQFIKGEEIATAIIPRGAKISDIDGNSDSENENNDNGTIETRVDITSIAECVDGSIVKESNADFIYDIEAVEQYGWIYRVIEWDNVTEPENLFKKAKEQLNYYKKQALNIELTAIDLHLLNIHIESIKIGDKIRVISPPHNLDCYMIVNEMTIDMDSPENTRISLISEERFSPPIMSSDNSHKIDEVEKEVSTNDTDYNKKFDEINNKLENLDLPDNLLSSDDLLLINGNYGGNFDPNTGEWGGNLDPSIYAKIVDVNSAFNELATLLGGV